MVNCKTIGFIVAFVLASALFFPVFFAVDYPEIQRAGYTGTTCQNLNSTLVSRYCCYSTCSSCTESALGTQDCGTVISNYNSISPSSCSGNGTGSCPTLGKTCGTGYKCCSQCCSTCTSCTTSCSNNVCTQSCRSYDCNCYCCDYVDNLQCTVTCPLCYTANIQVSYPVSNGTQISVYSKDFNTDLASAQALVSSKVVGGSEPCYYDPNRVSTVAFSISYTVGSWVGFGFVALIMLIVLIYGTKIFICDRYFSHYPHAANIFIWFGVLLPFGLFLPLRIAARVDEGTKNDFLIVMLVCIVIGIVPLGIAKWKHRNDECDDSECVEKVVRITKPGAMIPGDYSSTQKLNECSPQQYQPPNIPPPLQNGYRSADYAPSNGYSGQPDSSIVYQPPTIPPPGNYQPPSGPPPENYQPPTIPPPGNYQPPPGVYQPPNGPPSDYSSPYPPVQNNGADFKPQY